MDEKKEVCEKCHDTGIIKSPDGSVRTCIDCLTSGRLNQHSDKLPESRLKI